MQFANWSNRICVRPWISAVLQTYSAKLSSQDKDAIMTVCTAAFPFAVLFRLCRQQKMLRVARGLAQSKSHRVIKKEKTDIYRGVIGFICLISVSREYKCVRLLLNKRQRSNLWGE